MFIYTVVDTKLTGESKKVEGYNVQNILTNFFKCDNSAIYFIRFQNPEKHLHTLPISLNITGTLRHHNNFSSSLLYF